MQTANQAPTNLCTACPRTAAHALVLAEEERGDWKRERVRTQSGGGVVEDGGGLHDGGAHGGRAWVGAAVHLHLVDHRPGARARGHQSHQSGRRGLLLPLARGRRGSGGTSSGEHGVVVPCPRAWFLSDFWIGEARGEGEDWNWKRNVPSRRF